MPESKGESELGQVDDITELVLAIAAVLTASTGLLAAIAYKKHSNAFEGIIAEVQTRIQNGEALELKMSPTSLELKIPLEARPQGSNSGESPVLKLQESAIDTLSDVAHAKRYNQRTYLLINDLECFVDAIKRFDLEQAETSYANIITHLRDTTLSGGVRDELELMVRIVNAYDSSGDESVRSLLIENLQRTIKRCRAHAFPK